MFLILQGRAQKINKKIIWGCLGAIIVIGVAVLCYHKFYAPPKKAEAAVRFLRR